MGTVLGDRVSRSKRRLSRVGKRSAGAPYDSARRSLPRTQERVRRYSPLEPLSGSLLERLSGPWQVGLAPTLSLLRRARSWRPAALWASSVRSVVRPFLPSRRSDAYAALRVLRVMRPGKVMFCVRRKVRREVLHAFGVAGRRGLGAGGVRRTANSQWRC